MASHDNGKEDPKKAASVIMDPRLLMAARRGDCQLLENLLVNKVGQNVSQIGSNFVIRIPEMSSSTDATQEEEADHQLHKDTGKKKLAPTSQINHLFSDQINFICEFRGHSTRLYRYA